MNINRRDLLTQLALMASGSLAARLVKAGADVATLHAAPAVSALSSAQQRMVAQLVELIIPETDTPGAGKAGVHGFIDEIVTNWYLPEERQLFLTGLAELDSYCLQRYKTAFVACNAEQQTGAMLEAEQGMLSYQAGGANPSMGIQDEPDIHAPFFFRLKELTVLGYYTSEVGATSELSYNPIPTRYDGDVDFETLGRQWSS